MESRRAVSFREALLYWLKLGFINFGGPAGQIALMHRDLVVRRRWISEERFLHALNFCVLLPGPEAQQLAIYIGWLMHRIAGGLVAGILFVLPSVFVLLGLSVVYAVYGDMPAVAGVLDGLKPVIVAIVSQAVLRIGGRAVRQPGYLLLSAAAFFAIAVLRVPFPWIVLGSGLLGMAGLRAWPAGFSSEAPTTSEGAEPAEPQAASKHEARPPHTLPSAARTRRILAVGLLLWALPLAALVLWRGAESLPVRQYRFFTQAALVTFGGAYAVLAYVNQAAVESFRWITSEQALDGLALAETTPGPLIMVLQFVGFMTGWNHPGAMSPLASGVLGALVTTWTTFLPGFLFIFLGAPYIETLRGNRRLGAALAGITAAAVGVILNLALVFGKAVLFPEGLAAGPNWFAAGIAAAAFAALQWLRVDVLWVIAAGGAIGLARRLLA